MNTILTYLKNNAQQLGLEKFGDPARMTSTMLTPRFRASSHVIVFVRFDGKTTPALVAKVPRLPGDHARLARETAMLHAAHKWRAGGFDALPRVIAFDEYGHHKMLIETALAGQSMNPAFVRNNLDFSIKLGVDWLREFHSETRHFPADRKSWFAKQVDLPVNILKKALSLTDSEGRALDASRTLAAPLLHAKLPVVVSHNDFSPPNVMLCNGKSLGVVDWELADDDGLPGFDLFFYLKFIAFSKENAQDNAAYLRAFHNAFFAQDAWAAPYLADYADALEIEHTWLKPVFVLSWLQYVAGLITRLVDKAEEQGGPLDEQTAAWLRANRYFQLWLHSIEHIDAMKAA